MPDLSGGDWTEKFQVEFIDADYEATELTDSL